MILRPWCLRRAVASGPVAWGHLAKAWRIPENLARLAWLRGADRPEDLAWRLDPGWERTFDPFLMPGMAAAVARIRQALASREPLLVYGDYDADGVTATALLVRVLEKLGGQVSFFIPNRFSDGYGLHLDCIRQLVASGKRGLFISVDCGANSLAEVAASREWGIDWVITDHHALGGERPEARAVLHPGLGDFPNPHLSGVGVAFKLAQALMDAVPYPKGNDGAFLDGLLKLVALGTVADMVPLQGENALLVRRGMAALGGTNSPGLEALLRVAQVGGVKAQDLAFKVAPRLNAVGRLGGAEDAVHLLLCRDPREASALAERIEKLNSERRSIQDELLRRLPAPGDEAFDFVLEPGAHKGVIGVVAGNRMRDFSRPSAVCALTEGVAHCSLRAPEGYDLCELLAQAHPFLLSGGGHRLAGGITFDPAKLPFIRKVFERGAAEQAIRVGTPPLDTDGACLDLIPAAEELDRLEPFGQGFPSPLIVVEGKLMTPPDFFKGQHCRLRLEGIGEPLTWFSCEHALDTGTLHRLAVSPMDSVRWGRSWKVEMPVAAVVEP